MLEQVSLVRLIPTDPGCRHSAQIQTVNIGRRDEPLYQLIIRRDGGDNEARPKRRWNQVLSGLNDARKGKEEFLFASG